MAVKANPITIVGCGPGSPELVTPAARRAVEQAEVLLGAARLLALFAASAAERVVVDAHATRAPDEIAARRDRRVVVLVSGDPGLFSLAAPLLRRFGRDACEIIPGISSLQVACARLGLGWDDVLEGPRARGMHCPPLRLAPAKAA